MFLEMLLLFSPHYCESLYLMISALEDQKSTALIQVCWHEWAKSINDCTFAVLNLKMTDILCTSIKDLHSHSSHFVIVIYCYATLIYAKTKDIE